MPGSNYDPQNLPKSLDTLFDQDVQERRLRTIRRNLLGVADEVRALDSEVEPKRIVAAGQEAGYQTQITNLKTALASAETALLAIDALS